MIKTAIKLITPPIIMNLGKRIVGNRNPTPAKLAGPDEAAAERRIEFVDFYANTSLYALQVLQTHGNLKEMTLLSLGNRMSHLADYLALFKKVYLCTQLDTLIPMRADACPAELVELKGDFFDLPPLNIDCFISQASIHCLNDTRYGNLEVNGGWQRPYQAAAKLRQIIGQKPVPIIVSIAVANSESLIDDNARLDHNKFIESFVNAGFTLQEFFFDYLCYGLPTRPQYFEVQYRRAKELPPQEDLPGEYNYVIGTYYFL